MLKRLKEPLESDTKRLLLRTTRGIIDESGIDALTLREVGRRANLSRGAAYRHFRDKEDLLAAIAAEDFELMLDGFKAFSSSALEPRELARRMLLEFHSFGMASRVHYRLMFSTNWDGGKYPALRESAELAFGLARGLIARLLPADGVEPARAAERTALAFAFIHGLVELHLAGHYEESKGLDETERLVDELLRLISAI